MVLTIQKPNKMAAILFLDHLKTKLQNFGSRAFSIQAPTVLVMENIALVLCFFDKFNIKSGPGLGSDPKLLNPLHLIIRRTMLVQGLFNQKGGRRNDNKTLK